MLNSNLPDKNEKPKKRKKVKEKKGPRFLDEEFVDEPEDLTKAKKKEYINKIEQPYESKVFQIQIEVPSDNDDDQKVDRDIPPDVGSQIPIEQVSVQQKENVQEAPKVQEEIKQQQEVSEGVQLQKEKSKRLEEVKSVGSSGENISNKEDQPIKVEVPKQVAAPIIEKPEAKPANFNFNELEDMSDLMMDDLNDEGNYDMSNRVDDMDKISEADSKKEATDKDTGKSINVIFIDSKLLEFNSKGSVGVKLDSFISSDDKFDFNNVEEVGLAKTKSQFVKLKSLDSLPSALISKMGDKHLSDMLKQLVKEHKEVLGRLQEQVAINNKNLEIIKRSSNLNLLDMSDSKIQFAFLFASPLVRETNGLFKSVMQLNCQSEIEDILGSLRSLNYNLRYRVAVATRDNLRQTVIDCPVALHFSGHGVENNVESLGQTSVLTKDKGNLLLLEDKDGQTVYYFEEDLKTLVEVSKNKFEVVFVSSCHSEFAGKIFLNAGAKHVICIRQSEKISDAASLRFSNVFYETLFGKKIEVCDAFRTAKKDVEISINSTEANKFVLYTQETHGNRVGCKHK